MFPIFWISGPRNWHYGSVSGPRNWRYGSVSVPRNSDYVREKLYPLFGHYPNIVMSEITNQPASKASPQHLPLILLLPTATAELPLVVHHVSPHVQPLLGRLFHPGPHHGAFSWTGHLTSQIPCPPLRLVHPEHDHHVLQAVHHQHSSKFQRTSTCKLVKK